MKLSIAGRIFLRIVVIQLISAALIFGWYFYTVRADLNARVLDNAQKTVVQTIEATERYFGPAASVVEAAQRLLATDVLNRDRPDQLGRYLFEQLRLQRHFAGLYVGYPDGSFVYVMRSDEQSAGGIRTKVIRPHPDGREVVLTWHGPDYSTVKAARDLEDTYDPRTRPWYRNAVERPDVAWTKPYIFFTSGKPGITSSVAVKDGDGTIAAVVGVDIEMSEISQFLGQIAFSQGGSVFIVTPGGEVVAHNRADALLVDGLVDGTTSDTGPRFRKVAELDGIEGAAGGRILERSKEHSGAGASIVWKEEADDQDYFVVMGRIPGTNWPWLITAIVPEKSLTEIAGASSQVLIGVLLISAALASLLGYVLAQRIGRPLTRLHFNAKLARKGNIEFMENVKSSYTEVNETNDTLCKLAELQRRHGASVDVKPASQVADSGVQKDR